MPHLGPLSWFIFCLFISFLFLFFLIPKQPKLIPKNNFKMMKTKKMILKW